MIVVSWRTPATVSASKHPAELRVGIIQSLDLFRRAPSNAMPDDVILRKMHEHHTRLVLCDDLYRVIGHLGIGARLGLQDVEVIDIVGEDRKF